MNICRGLRGGKAGKIIVTCVDAEPGSYTVTRENVDVFLRSA